MLLSEFNILFFFNYIRLNFNVKFDKSPLKYSNIKYFMKTTDTKRNLINFQRIGFEFRRIDKNNSPISTAALIINQSLNDPSMQLKDIINLNEYQILLKISVIFYRRFGFDPVIHFNNLISLVNWSTGNHLGEYVFLQIILGIPNTHISCEQIHLACKLFPTLFEPIFISRIYINPDLLFTSGCPKLPSNQPITTDYLVKCGADNYMIEHFLTLTFNSSLNFLRQVCESRHYQVLLGLLIIRPDFFSAIENLCRDDLFEVISQIMFSGMSNFLDTFFSNYKKIPSSIIKCVSSNLNTSNINQYTKKISTKNYQNLFNYIFENECTDMLQDGLTFNDNFIPCVNNLYQKSPDLILRMFRNTNNQVLNSTIGSILLASTEDFYSLPYALIDAVLAKPDFAYDFQVECPRFFIFILNRYPSCAMAIAGIINQKLFMPKQGVILRERSSDRLPKITRSIESKGKNPNYFDPDDIYPQEDDDVKEIGASKIKRTQSIDEIIPKSKQILRLIYEIDENALCGCFSSNSNYIINLLLNFVPRLIMPKQQNQNINSNEFQSEDQGPLDLNRNIQSNPKNPNLKKKRSKYHQPSKNDDTRQSTTSDNDDDNDNDNRYSQATLSINNGNNTNTSRSRNQRNIEIDIPGKPETNDPHQMNNDQSVYVSKDNNNNADQNTPILVNEENPQKLVLNPHHLHFPSAGFFVTCENRRLLPPNDLNSFFTNFIDFIVNDHDWMTIIPQVPLLFYQFSSVLFKHDEFRKHFAPLTVAFASNMYPTFRTSRDSFTAFTEFLLDRQSFININDFPLFLKIKLVLLLTTYLNNTGGPLVNLFILLAKDYRSFIALDSDSKEIIWNVYINGNLDHPNCHRAFIMAYDDHNSLMQPQTYIESIMKNKDAIASTLSDDESYFEKWYNLVIKGLDSPIYQAAQHMAREQARSFGNSMIFKFFRTVMLNGLNFKKFQNNIEFLSLLSSFLDPQSHIYNGNGQVEIINGNVPFEKLSLNIPRNILRIVLNNKSARAQSGDTVHLYNIIYNLFITFYDFELFRAIPMPLSLTEESRFDPR